MTRRIRGSRSGYRRAFVGAALTLCSAAVVLSACSDDPETIKCEQTAGPSTISGDLAIQYSASATVGGAISQITYTTDAGNVVVNNPTLPWEFAVTNVTAPAQISLVGTVTGSGSVLVEYDANGGVGRTETDDDGCVLNQ